jgi:hypothetical protein
MQGVHNRVLKLCSQRKECASELFSSQREHARRAHQNIHNLKRSLKVTEHLGGETVQRRHKETKLLKIL